MVDSRNGLAASEPFGSYRVRAHNIASDSDNKIHDDTVARRYGFAGGLVPGIVVYGYLTRPVVERLGAAWLERGSASARFLQPCYQGEDITVEAVSSASGVDPVTIDLCAQRPDGTICARGTARFPANAADAPDVAAYPTASLPAERPPASAAALVPGTVLGSFTVRLDARRGTGFADSIADDLPLYRGPEGTAHPALLLQLANEALAENVRLGPWIHAASEVTHHSLARYGDAVTVRGRVADCFERKGHEFVVLDLLLVAEPARPVQHIRHTAIYRPRSAAAAD